MVDSREINGVGEMTEAVWIALIVNMAGLIGLLIKMTKDGRAKKTGNNPHPCENHDTRIDQVEKDLGIVKNDVKYIRIEVTRIRDKQNGVK